jgi:hypothetical protein
MRANLRREWSTISKADWSLGYVLAIDSKGRTIWNVDAHRGDGKRFVVHADDKLSAFVELEPSRFISNPFVPMTNDRN